MTAVSNSEIFSFASFPGAVCQLPIRLYHGLQRLPLPLWQDHGSVGLLCKEYILNMPVRTKVRSIDE